MKAALGAALWTLATVAGWFLIARIPAPARSAWSRAETELWRSVISSSPTVEVLFEQSAFLAVGDGVFLLREDELLRVGEVEATEQRPEGLWTRLRLDASLPAMELGARTEAVLRTQGETFEHCLRLMVDERQREAIEALAREFLERRQVRLEERFERLLPGLLEASRDFLLQEMDGALDRHRDEFEALMQRARTEIAEEHAIPLLVEEIWPIFEEEAREPARALGRELWQRAPLFGLAWRAAWDGMVSDEPNRLERRFEEFLEEEAGPALREHEDTIRAAMSRVLQRIVASDAVRSRVRELARNTVRDPQLRGLVRRMIEEMLVGNPRLLAFLRERWTDPDLRRELEDLNGPLQNLLARVGNLLVFEDPSERDRIHPGLVRVLRLVLLKRDKRFVFLQPGEGPELEEGQMLRGRVDG